MLRNYDAEANGDPQTGLEPLIRSEMPITDEASFLSFIHALTYPTLNSWDHRRSDRRIEPEKAERLARWLGRTAALLFCIVLVACGCMTTPPPLAENFPVPEEPEVILQPGDVLTVKFLYWPELDEREQAIRPDGKISLQLIGDVQAAGYTPAALRNELLARYESKLNDPEISVVVDSLNSHRVYVGGEVLSPGLVMIDGRLTALEAIMQAGGFNKTSAKMGNVVVVRNREGRQFACSLDLRKALEEPASDPFYLEPNDIVFVPRTAIDRVDQWVDQYINQIVPRAVHYNFTHEVSVRRSGGGNNIASQLLGNAANLSSGPRMGVLSSGTN